MPKKTSTVSLAGGSARWFSIDADKNWSERYFLWFSIYWLAMMGGCVATGAYLAWGDIGYATFGVVISAPALLGPALLRGGSDWSRAYWFKANVWIAIFGFIGNYFWTHYFYTVLGASYSFPVTWHLNGVPLLCYLITHAYFIAYHTFAAVLLRRVRTGGFYRSSNEFVQFLVNCLVIGGFSYFTAFMEAATLDGFPYYQHTDRWLMYKYGSAFYALYFIVSFPMFLRIDENPAKPWNLSRTAIDAFGAAMVVFLLCDFWRLLIGRLPGVPERLCLPWQNV